MRASPTARMCPEEDAPSLVADFMNVMSSFIGDEAWGVLMGLVPGDLHADRTAADRRDGSVEEFLLEMSDEEAVEEGRAAEHARVVAESLRARADSTQLLALQESIEDDDILALFELSRGGLSEPETPTAGGKAQSGELDAPKPSQPRER